MKNPDCSRLRKKYNKQVIDFNERVKRVIKNKYEMSYLWKYKNDYPADWKRKAEMLDADRKYIVQLRLDIKALKDSIRKCNAEHPQQ